MSLGSRPQSKDKVIFYFILCLYSTKACLKGQGHLWANVKVSHSDYGELLILFLILSLSLPCPVCLFSDTVVIKDHQNRNKFQCFCDKIFQQHFLKMLQ